jgi:hypothetical protein
MQRAVVVLVALLALPALQAVAHAEGERAADKGVLGLGIILGEPTGVTARLYLKDDQALQAAVGSAFIGNGLQASADYCFHPFILQDKDSFTLPFYVGPGVRLMEYSAGQYSKSYFAAGLRGVAGLLFDFKTVPLDAFVEVAGVVEYRFQGGGGGNVALNAGAGLRYYF